MAVVVLFSVTSFGIKGGELTNSDTVNPFWKHTLKVVFSGGLICSGFIISENEFITAGHCFEGETSFGVELQDMSDKNGRVKTTTYRGRIGSVKTPLDLYSPIDFLYAYDHDLSFVKRKTQFPFSDVREIFSTQNLIEIPPGHSEADLFELSFSTGDIALVTLPRGDFFAKPHEPAPIFPFEEYFIMSGHSFDSFAGLDFYISGFGETSFDGESTVKKLRHSKQRLHAYGKINPSLGGLTRIDNLGVFYAGGATVDGSGCFGDSGAPLFVQYKNQLFAVGVQNYELSRCSYSGFASLSLYKEWLNKN